MVKSAYILASLTTVFSVIIAQEATPTASGITIPTAIPSNLSLPTEIADVVSSLIRNPSGINSYISVASDQVSQLPSQYQASAYSALAAASKSVAAIQPSNSAGASTSAANSNSASTPLVVGVLVATAVLASLF